MPHWRALIQKCCHFYEIFINGCIRSCQNDNLQCSQWLRFRQNDISVSANVIIHWLKSTLLWRHNGCDGTSNHHPHECLLNRSFMRRAKKTSKLRVTGLCAGNSPGTGELPAQMASNVENVFIWWRHHAGFNAAMPFSSFNPCSILCACIFRHAASTSAKRLRCRIRLVRIALKVRCDYLENKYCNWQRPFFMLETYSVVMLLRL